MKTKERLIVHFLLRQLQKRMESDKSVSIDPIWSKLFELSELKTIIRWMFLGKEPDHLTLETMSSQQLLDEIGDDYHMVAYFIEVKEKELETTVHPTTQSVLDVLSQLGLETHYLNSKSIETWDKYDHGNFKGLQSKAGTEVPLYGIYPALMEAKDKYITPVIGKYHKHKSQAESALSILSTTGEYNLEDFQVLPV